MLSLCLVTALGCQGAAPPGDAAQGKHALRGSRWDHPLARGPVTPPRGPASAPRRPVPGAAALSPQAAAPAAACTGTNLPRRLKLLLITALPSEPAYLAMSSSLEQLGVPFDTLVATTSTLSAAQLESAGVGSYQGVILSSAELGFEDSSGNFVSAFSPSEWSTLWAYEARYCVRQVNLYTFPGSFPEDLGLTLRGTRDTDAAPLPATLTAAGRALFSYLQPSASIPIRFAWTYLATAGPGVTTLLSGGGGALVSLHSSADGREQLSCTFDHNPELVHSQLLSYGLVKWVSGGVFLGYRRYYENAQVDDVFYPDVLWDPALGATNPDKTYRMSDADLNRTLQGQAQLRAQVPLAQAFVYDMAFNGEGTVLFGANDALTRRAQQVQAQLRWLNHTYTHLQLDAASYADAVQEISLNNQVARGLGLSRYAADALVTGEHSGFSNPEFARAAVDTGVRLAASDGSRSGQQSPSPNTGVVSAFQPALLWVPRRPANLFFNVSTPAEETSEYNSLYRSFWGRDLSYEEILQSEVDVAMNTLLKYAANPQYFHQTNLRSYDAAGHQLLGDFLNRLLLRYQGWLAVPLLSLSHRDIGLLMRARAAYDRSGVTGTWIPAARQVTLRVQNAAQVPLTGALSGDLYGDQRTAFVNMSPGAPQVLAVN